MCEIMAANDWIKISRKYSGVCLKCKKKLESGHYGYWSRSSKSILHENCFNDLNFDSSKIDKLTDVDDSIESLIVEDNEPKIVCGLPPESVHQSVSHVNKRLKNERNIKCYICNNVVDLKDELVNSLLIIAEKFSSKVDVFYCHDCLEKFNDVVIGQYRKKFMNQI